MRAKPCTVREAQLFKRLSRRARTAALTVLESLTDIDPPRATRFIEAVAMFVTFATRTAPQGRGARRGRRP